MRNLKILGLMWAGVATAASAQLVGGGLGAGVGASMGSTVGGVGAATGAAAGVSGGATSSDVTGAVRGTTGDALRGAGSAARDAASDGGRAGGAATGGKIVQVKAGARVRTTRETRCYDGASYWNPYYGPDGYYYCESQGPGAAAGVGVKAGG